MRFRHTAAMFPAGNAFTCIEPASITKRREEKPAENFIFVELLVGKGNLRDDLKWRR